MIQKLIKYWLFSSFYIYLFLLADTRSTTPFSTNEYLIINTVYFYAFLLAALIAFVYTLWCHLLPILNKYFNEIMIFFFIIFGYAWMNTITIDATMHISIFLGTLAYQLLRYRLLNGKDSRPKMNKKRLSIICGVTLIVGAIGYKMYTNTLVSFEKIYPNKVEATDIFNTDIESCSIQPAEDLPINTKVIYGTDVYTAYYGFTNYYFNKVECATTIKNQTKDFAKHHLISQAALDVMQANGYYKPLESNFENLSIYKKLNNRVEEFSSIDAIFAVYQTDVYSVYFYGEINEDQRIEDSNYLEIVENFYQFVKEHIEVN